MESVNQHMKNSPLNVGVITPPDRFYKPVLYSEPLASQAFNQLDHDIYESVKKSKNLNEKKTPKSVLILLGIASIALSIPFLKKLFRK